MNDKQKQILFAICAAMGFVLGLVMCNGAKADSLQVGKSSRTGDFEAAYTLRLTDRWGLQGEYIDEGRQPENIQNINRTVNIDAIYRLTVNDKLYLEGRTGLTSSRLSHNGSGNAYSNRTGLTGYNLGVGAGYRIVGGAALVGGLVRLHYQQSDRAAFEDYTFAYAGVRFEW